MSEIEPLAPCPFCGVSPKECISFNTKAVEHPVNECRLRGMVWKLTDWNTRQERSGLRVKEELCTTASNGVNGTGDICSTKKDTVTDAEEKGIIDFGSFICVLTRYKNNELTGEQFYKEICLTSPQGLKPLSSKDELLGVVAQGWCTNNNKDKCMDADLAMDITLAVWNKFAVPNEGLNRKEYKELLEASKEWLQWFDYLSAYQHENLVNGQTLESASENWNSMTQPSPPIDRLRNALSALENKR